MAMKGSVKYANYKGSAGGGTKNKRKKKLSRERMEDAICLRMRHQQEEKAKNINKNQYAKEAKEWSERYEY